LKGRTHHLDRAKMVKQYQTTSANFKTDCNLLALPNLGNLPSH